MPYIGRDTDKISNVEVLDNITFDGSSSYTLQKGGSNFTPSSANTLLLSIDGVVQAGNFTVSGSTIDFGTAVAGTSTCDFVLHYGVGLITAPSDGSVTEAKIGTGAVTSAKLASGAVPNQSAFKNIIINGDMSIAQRGTSVSSITGADYYTVDRWQIYMANSGTYTQSQSTDVPSGQGFAKSLKMDCTTAAASPIAGAQLYLRTKFEGQNLQYLKYGTSSAESMTLSFWVKCNKATTASIQLQDHDNSKMVTKSYTINSANTWEKKTITFNGNTSNSFTNDANLSLDVRWWLESGSDFTSGTPSGDWEANDNTKRNNNNLALSSSTSNEFYITGVQLEAGTSASDFEFLPVDVNLNRCQRYYYTFVDKRTSGVSPVTEQNSIGTGVTHYGNQMVVSISMPVNMRTIPSVDQVTGTDYFQYYHDQTGDNFDSFNNISGNGVTSMMISNTNQISATVGTCGIVYATNAAAVVAFEAEL